jgi:HPt (histidine-containing phosphotransfer) domain-containing protein
LLTEEEHLAVLENFLTETRHQLGAMYTAHSERDFAELAALAHSLKGAGGTFGFHQYTAPLATLEERAAYQSDEGVDDILGELAVITESVALELQQRVSAAPARAISGDPGSATETGTSAKARGPIRSSLPTDDPQIARIVVGFVARLHGQLEELQEAWRARDLERLAKLAHWLKGSAGTVGFEAFTEPAKRLQHLAEREQEDQIDTLLEEILLLADAIEVPCDVT